ncbi:hypothetical protein JVU11DRAFT_2872 [Chiua virens]|nr:hypothetical protein JVU11DRAFT_2872 [Chiua virens]
MSWKSFFDKGVAYFKHGDLEQALVHMNNAAELQNDGFIVYDSRAAIYEKLGDHKAALLDSKRVVDLAPDRWQGYARSARLFNLVGKYDSAIKMVDYALNRLRPEDVQRRVQLGQLREKAVTARTVAGKQRLAQVAQNSYLLGKLPVETLVEIFSILIDDDHTWAVRLSHVCGHWRRILVNTPSAWQTLVLTKKHPLRKTTLWKQRTDNRIARISDAMSELDRDSVFAELGDLSWVHLSSLHISANAFTQLHQALSDISNPHAFSNLTELTLVHSVSHDPLSCCLSGPDWKLRILRFDGFTQLRNGWWKHIKQLKELYLIGPVETFSTLAITSNPLLEKFVFNGEYEDLDDSSDNNAPSKSMSHLKSIELRNTWRPLRFMRAITAPSITYFSIHQNSVGTDETLFHIASCPALVELHITHCSLSWSTLPTLLPSTPNLTTVRINAVADVANALFDFLAPETVDALHPLPCRALKHVDVSGCSDLTTSNVYMFVKTRVRYASETVALAERCAVIESLKVDACPNIEPDMLPWFRSKVIRFSCVYASKDKKRNRRR